MNDHSKPLLVIGLGNPLMRDEGIGLVLARRLTEMTRNWPGVEVVEAGTSLMAALHRMAGRKKVVFLDCAFMDASPGTCRRFAPEEARSIKQNAGCSLHEGDLLSMLELARQLGASPEEIVIFGIEPASVEVGEGLSDVLQVRLTEYVQAVLSELRASCSGPAGKQ